MAKKKNKVVTWIIILLALLIVAYIIYKSTQETARLQGKKLIDPNLPEGCYPLEEIHEASTSGQMWVGIIPFDANGDPTIRPAKNTASIGDQFTISNTGSALDGTYTIRGIWYDDHGNSDIGALRVDIPAGLVFNYTAVQGELLDQPRDITYFGIGHICFNS